MPGCDHACIWKSTKVIDVVVVAVKIIVVVIVSESQRLEEPESKKIRKSQSLPSYPKNTLRGS